MMPESVRPVRFDVTKFLAFHGFGDALDLSDVPQPHRESMRLYLSAGILPGHSLRKLLEGNIEAVRLFRDDLPALLALTDWLHNDLPASCWGSPDQVQLWCSFVRARNTNGKDAR